MTIPPEIIEIGKLVATQNNLCTGQPMFMVQSRRRIYGIDSDYSDDDKIVWVSDGEEVTDPDEIKHLNDRYENGLNTEETRTGYIDIWENRQACLTRAGAEAVIRADGHNMTDPRIYVESGHRNGEWKTLRAFLLQVAKEWE